MPMNHVIVTLNKRTPSTNDACARKLGLQRAPCSPQLLCVQEVNHCVIHLICFALYCLPDCLPECITHCLPGCLPVYPVEVRIVYLIGFVLST